MESLKKATKVTLYDDVINQIHTLIREGILKPGDSLPPERELATQMGVNRNTLREALKALNLMGVLDSRQGGGNYISKDMNLQLISSSLKFISAQDVEEALNLLETRRVLESACAYRAAKNSTPELVARLEEMLDGLRKHIVDPELSAHYDTRFHELIADAANNPFMYEMIRALRAPQIEIMYKTTAIERLRPYTIIYHEKILEAINQKDALAAEQCMREHIEKTEDELRQSNATKPIFQVDRS